MFHPTLFVTALACILCLHAGANILSGRVDLATARGGLTWWGVTLLLAGGAAGGALAFNRGLLGLGFAIACLLLATIQALPPLPLPLSARGLGEGAVAVGTSLPVALAAGLQSGRIGLDALLAALVVGCWTAAVLICAEIPALRADAEAGRRTLMVRLGIRHVPSLYLAIQATAAAALLALGWLADLPAWATLPPVAMMLVALAAAPMMMMRDRASQLSALRLTLGIHLGGGVLLILAALV